MLGLTDLFRFHPDIATAFYAIIDPDHASGDSSIASTLTAADIKRPRPTRKRSVTDRIIRKLPAPEPAQRKLTFKIHHVEDQPGASVVRLSGTVDQDSVGNLRYKFEKLLAREFRRFIFDFRRVKNANLHGISVINGLARMDGVERVAGVGVAAGVKIIFDMLDEPVSMRFFSETSEAEAFLQAELDPESGIYRVPTRARVARPKRPSDEESNDGPIRLSKADVVVKPAPIGHAANDTANATDDSAESKALTPPPVIETSAAEIVEPPPRAPLMAPSPTIAVPPAIAAAAPDESTAGPRPLAMPGALAVAAAAAATADDNAPRKNDSSPEFTEESDEPDEAEIAEAADVTTTADASTSPSQRFEVGSDVILLADPASNRLEAIQLEGPADARRILDALTRQQDLVDAMGMLQSPAAVDALKRIVSHQAAIDASRGDWLDQTRGAVFSIMRNGEARGRLDAARLEALVDWGILTRDDEVVPVSRDAGTSAAADAGPTPATVGDIVGTGTRSARLAAAKNAAGKAGGRLTDTTKPRDDSFVDTTRLLRRGKE
jgi:hypothetical protein